MSWSDLVEMGWTGKEMKHFELDGEMQVYVYVSIDREKKKTDKKNAICITWRMFRYELGFMKWWKTGFNCRFGVRFGVRAKTSEDDIVVK